MKSSDEPTPETARAAMVAALISVRSHLPPAIQAGVLVAARTTDVRENEIARVALWEVINGREQSDTPEVLHTRLAIAVLHPGDIASDTQTSLEYFVDWSDGCVGLSNEDMDAVWSAVDVGTPIQIHP